MPALMKLSTIVESAKPARPSAAGSATKRAGPRSGFSPLIEVGCGGAAVAVPLLMIGTSSLSGGLGFGAQGPLQDLREVERRLAAAVLDLRAAAEAVADDEGARLGLAERRHQHPLGRLHRDLVVLAGLVAEGA